jgi:hypothetical protein
LDLKTLDSASNIWANPDIDGAYRLLAFDVLIENGDRKPGDMLRGPTTGDTVLDGLIAIDFGNALTGGHWSPGHLRANHDTPLDPVGDWLFWGHPDHDLGQRIARNIASMRDVFQVAINDVTPHWGLDEEDRAAVADFLFGRSKNLSSLVARAIDRASKGS